jgi:hypothetical protein
VLRKLQVGVLRGARPSEGCLILNVFSASQLYCVHWHADRAFSLRNTPTLHHSQLSRIEPFQNSAKTGAHYSKQNETKRTKNKYEKCLLNRVFELFRKNLDYDP